MLVNSLSSDKSRRRLFNPFRQALQVSENHSNVNVVFRVCRRPGIQNIESIETRTKRLGMLMYKRLIEMEGLRLKDPIKSVHKCINFEKLEPYIGRMSEDAMLKMDTPKLLQIITHSREDSMAVQALLLSCSEAALAHLLKAIEFSIPTLIFHHYAVYVLVRLVGRSSDAATVVSSTILKSFNELCHHEHASRLMQAMCERSLTFRRETVRRYSASWPRNISSISGVFLLTACIRYADSANEFELIRRHLIEDRRLIPYSKSHRRLIVVFTEQCIQSDLQMIADLLCNRRLGFFRLVDDKYLVFAVLNLITRGVNSVLCQLTHWLSTKPVKLFQAKYSRLLLYKLLALGVSETFIPLISNLIKNQKGNSQILNSPAIPEQDHMYLVWLLLEFGNKDSHDISLDSVCDAVSTTFGILSDQG